EHFMKKSSIISFSKEALFSLGKDCALLADTEGLGAHEASIKIRLES
ncbi:MAG: histidinol dehydrogenase, partial [Sulfurospirillaceae bacterium]